MSETSESAVEMTLEQKRALLAAMLRKRREARTFPLSFTQHRLWLLNQLEPDSPLYNVTHALRLKGSLDVAALERSIQEIWRRHEILRATFDLVDGDPVQRFGSDTTFVTQKEDVSHLAEGERKAALPQLVRGEAQRPFDIGRGPLLRAKLWRLSDEDHLLMLTMHHIVSDGWSRGVLTRELSALYTAFASGQPSPLADLPIQYADYAVWQREHLRGPLMAEQLSYWKRQLAGAPASLELPTDHPRPTAPTHSGARHHFRLSAELAEGLRRLSREEGATLFMMLLAGWQALLSRYSNQQDICVGTPVAGRMRVETEELIGFFVNTLVLRTDLSGGPSFRELVGRVREVCLGAYAHQETPFEKLVEELQPERSLSRTPLFQVMFILQNTPREEWSLGRLDARTVESGAGTVKFDLTLVVADAPGGGLAGSIEYSTDLFEAGTVERLARNFETLLRGAVAEPEAAVARLPLMSEQELELVLRVWNETAAEYPTGVCLHELFERQVEQTPSAVALVYGDEKLSYRELNRRANRLARRLRQHGVGPDSLVGVMMERSVEMVVALLGVLKAGGAYAPLDPSYPQERVSFMLADAAPLVLLTQSHLASRGEGYGGHVIALDLEAAAGQKSDDVNPEAVAGPDDVAYTIYTSGSTGRPKGVQVPHRGVVNLLSSVAETFGVTQDDVLLSVTSLSFDIAGLELFMPLLRGARVVVAARDEAADSSRLAERISGSGITIMQATPATWRLLVEGGWDPVPARLKVICGGEALDAKLAARLRERCAELWNKYGPTETTIYSTAHRVEGADGTIPIGRPLANTQVYVLDEGMGAAPLGVAGELYIGGVGVARGYLNRPALTAEKFVPNPFAESGGERLYRTGDLVRYRPDGEIEYLGRLDHQVKIRGFRIELGEIEAVLGKHEAVEQAVVVVQGRETGAGPRLAAYYIGEAGAEELRQWAKAKLPEYMVPWALVRLEQIPVMPNGKVDRRALPEATAEDAATHAAPAAPRTLVEEMVAGVWREVLGLERVGVNDDFFELGGHSLLAVRVVTRLRESFQLEMPLRVIFENRTVASLAAVIEEQNRVANKVQSPHIPRAPRGKEPTLSITQESWLLREWAEGLYSVKSRVMNTQMAYRLRGPLDVGALERTLNEIVRRHDNLRSTFPKPKGVLSFKFLRPVFRLMMESRKARKALSRKPHTPMPRVKALGEPYLRILPKLALRLPVIDLRGRDEGEREAECQRVVYEASRTPFDHERGPIARAVLLRTRDDEHVLTVVISHYVCDGWSMKVLMDEVEKLYEAFATGKKSPLPELPIQYPDYALWQRKWLSGEVLTSMISYWKQKLDKIGLYPVVELPFARAEATSADYHRSGLIESHVVPRELHQSLKALSQSESVTLFMLLLAVLQVMLRHYTGKEQIGVLSSFLNRSRPETQGLIGWFNSFHVLDADLSGDPRFTDLLKQAREAVLGGYEHQEIPFPLLVMILATQFKDYDLPALNAPYVYFDMMPQASSARRIHDLSASPFSLPKSAKGASIDAGIEMYATEMEDGLKLSVKYPTVRFAAEDIAAMLRLYRAMLERAVSDRDARVSDLLAAARGGAATA